MPLRAPRPCAHTGCRRLTRKGSYCDNHAEQHKHNWQDDRYRGNRHERGYGTAWTKLREGILSRDEYRCQPCAAAGRVTPATEVDHIVAKRYGGSDEPDNLQAICRWCHRQKTAREQGRDAGKRPGCTADGMPLDGDHHWYKR